MAISMTHFIHMRVQHRGRRWGKRERKKMTPFFFYSGEGEGIVNPLCRVTFKQGWLQNSSMGNLFVCLCDINSVKRSKKLVGLLLILVTYIGNILGNKVLQAIILARNVSTN